MRKLICAVLLCALLVACGGALAADEPTAEALLAGNSLSLCLGRGEYTREYVEYLDAEGNVCDYNDIIYRCGESGYTMLLAYPVDSGAQVEAMLVGGNYYATLRSGETAYVLYASRTYADAGSELALGADAYIAYPALNEGLELAAGEDGGYVVTARLSAAMCDQNAITQGGHDVAADETVYQEFYYDIALNLTGEALYYMRDGEKRLCERTAFTYDAGGDEYARYTAALDAEPREITVVLAPGQEGETRMTYAVAGDATLSFVLGEGGRLFADELCTQEVPAQGAADDFTQDTYYALAG